jgi:hypothetical protein
LNPDQLAEFPCKYCGKSFTDGRKLGGHVRQAHSPKYQPSPPTQLAVDGEGEAAAKILELWKQGSNPLMVISVLRVHPRFVKEVLSEYDELLNEWKKFREA